MKRLDLRNGAKLRFEVSRMTNNRLLLKMVAVLKRNGKSIEVEHSRKVCDTEEVMWAAMVEIAQDRLCDLAEIDE